MVVGVDDMGVFEQLGDGVVMVVGMVPRELGVGGERPPQKKRSKISSTPDMLLFSDAT